MAASDLLDIWNAALLNATARTSIGSLTEQSAEAAACALRYPSIVRTLLRGTDWNCVRRRLALEEAACGAVWPPSWTYMFVHPADCLAIRGFDMGLPQASFPNWTRVDYEIADDASAGKTILMNIACPVMIYTSYELDLVNGTYEAKFDASLREALGWALAAAIAGPLTGSRSITDAVKAEAKSMIDQARAANANESAPNSVNQDVESLAVRGAVDCPPYGWQGLWPRSF
ncbi:hypothetical protein [Reyranella sp.]|uniref:hypothetical protein n=1 Tax=Reyranella sp. TaxID=1929291 RepID=UPI003D0E264D